MTEVAASVLVPTHNGGHRLPELLTSLTQQQTSCDWEIVISVDGSVDDTLDILARWTERLPLTVVFAAERAGSGSAMNRAIQAARGEILIRCDDDLTPGDGFIDRHLSWHGDGRDMAVIGLTRNLFRGGPYADAYGRAADARARAAAYAAPSHLMWRHWAANNSVRRSTMQAVGGFDERFRYGQDSELGWRIYRAGVGIVIDPELEIVHRGPATDVATRAARAFVSGASRRLLHEVHPLTNSAASPSLRRTLPQAAWNGMVESTSRITGSREGYFRLGRILDTCLPLLPRRMSRRAIALMVEAAGRAGYVSGSTDLSHYSTQKADELSRERSRG